MFGTASTRAWRRCAFVAAPMLLLILLVPEVAGAAPRGRSEDKAAAAARSQQVNDYIMNLRAEGASQDQIDADLAADLGLRRVPSTDEPLASAMSTNQNVTIYTPYIYQDTSTGRWIAIADFSWKRKSTGEPYWTSDVGTISVGDTAQHNIGGLDGFGLRFSRAVTYYSTTMSVQGNNGGPVTRLVNPSSVNAYGAAFNNQDFFKSCCGYGLFGTYSWDYGIISYVFSTSCSTFQVFSQLNHTWSSTKLNSFTVSSTGQFSATFSSTSYRWSAGNPIGTGNLTVC